MTRMAASLLAITLAVAPAAAEPITELEPFLKDGAVAEGTPAGDGSYTDVTLGKDGETKVEKFSFSVDGDRLTDLRMEGISGAPDEDGTVATGDLIEVVGSSIPMDLENAEPKEIFDFFLGLDTERAALKGFKVVDGDIVTTLEELAIDDVVDGRVGSIVMSNLLVDGKTDDGQPLKVRIGEVSLRGAGAAWAIYMRNLADVSAPSDDPAMEALLSDETAFLNDYKLSDYLHQMKLESMAIRDLTVDVEGKPVFELDAYEFKTTQFVDDFPVAGVGAFSGSVNMETISDLPMDSPQAAMGMKAFLAAYGKPVVAFSGRTEQIWSEAERKATVTVLGLEIDGLLKQSLDMTITGYNPADVLAAAESFDDDITMVSVMEGAMVEDMALSLTDEGALDIGFSLAPPGIERGQIAAQAGQFAGIGVVQAMQYGISLSGSIAEVVTGFIKDGGTITIRQADGSSLPMGKLYTLMADPENEALAMEILSQIKLEVTGSP